MRGFALLLLLTLLVVAPAAGAPPPGSEQGVTWFVQVSDVHVSRFHPSRAAELGGPFAALLALLRPAALLVTGDLTDAKSRDGLSGRQSGAEWAAWRGAAAGLRAALGPAAPLLPLRGNHDTFAVPSRGGAADSFAAAEERAAGDGAPPAARLHPRVTVLDLGAPPAVVRLVALDASRSPGLARPCNFAGDAAPLLPQLEAALAEAAASSPGRRVPPAALVAAAHYPLALVERGWALGRALAAANASALLDGHLHWRFGRRLHVRHRWRAGPAAGSAGEAGRRRGWGSAPQRQPPPPGAPQPPLSLLELEAGDWKASRAWRLVAVDAGGGGGGGSGALSFRDFEFDAAAPPGSAAAAVLLVTAPADARHAPPSPPPRPAAAEGDGEEGLAVRALFFGGGGSDGAAATELAAEAACAEAAGARGARPPQEAARAARATLRRAAPWPSPLFAGALPRAALAALRCPPPGRLTLTVSAPVDAGAGGGGGGGGGGGAAPAPSHSVALRLGWPGGGGGGGGGGGAEPTGAPLLARLALSLDGPAAGRAALAAVGLVHGAAAALAPPLAPARRPALRAAVLAHAALLALGPWALAARLLGPDEPAGRVYAAGFALPLLQPAGGDGGASPSPSPSPPSPPLVYAPNSDAVFLTGPQAVLNLLWLGALCGALALRDAARAGGCGGGSRALPAAAQPPAAAAAARDAAAPRAGRRLAAARALLLLCCASLAALQAWCFEELWVAYGPAALLLSPGFAWPPALAAAALAVDVAAGARGARAAARAHKRC